MWVWSQPDLTSDVLSIFRPESLATSAEGTRIFTLSKRNKTKTKFQTKIVTTTEAKWPKCMFTVMERDCM